MTTPLQKTRMDLVEEEVISLSVRVDEIINMLKNQLRPNGENSTPEVSKAGGITPPNTEMRAFLDLEVPYKPSKRDRESISGFFTTEPFTPAPTENIGHNRDNVKEHQKPDFILEFEKFEKTTGTIGNNLITEIVVNETSKYITVSLKTIKLATDKLQLLRTENPQGAKKLKLAYFFNQASMDMVYNKQIAIKGSCLQIFENPTRLYLAEDDVFLKLLCDTVRPVSADDHLLKLLQVVQLDYITDEFEFKGFHRRHLPKAMHQLNKLRVFDSFIRYMASPSDLSMLILNGYGKDKAPQMTRVILAFFGTLTERLTVGIGEEKLKKMNSPGEVFNAIHKYLTKLANQAHEYELDENASNTCPNIMNAFSKLKKKSYENTTRPYPSLKKLVPTTTTEAKALEDEEGIKQELSDEYNDSDIDNQSLDSSDDLMFLQRPNVSTKQKLNTKDMPCYKIIFGKICEEGSNCKYSHDRDVLTKHVSASLEKWSKSPFATTKSNTQHADRPYGHHNQQKFLATKGNVKIMQREQSEDLPRGSHN